MLITTSQFAAWSQPATGGAKTNSAMRCPAEKSPCWEWEESRKWVWTCKPALLSSAEFQLWNLFKSLHRWILTEAKKISNVFAEQDYIISLIQSRDLWLQKCDLRVFSKHKLEVVLRHIVVADKFELVVFFIATCHNHFLVQICWSWNYIKQI